MGWVGKSLLALVAACLIAAGSFWTIDLRAHPAVASSDDLKLVRTKDGLLFADSFGKALPVRDLGDDYEFNGSAPPGVGYQQLKDSGLGIGVGQHAAQFEGWFAVTNSAFPSGSVFHVRMSKPKGNVSGSGQQGEAVFAVQTGTTKQTGLINYVVVSSNSLLGNTSWLVGYSHGRIQNATLNVLAQTEPSPQAANTQEISLRTDGAKDLTVYFGNDLHYQSSKLSMEIQGPYQPYLEVQSRQLPYLSTFQDFWITRDDAIEVSGVTPHRPVRLVTATGRVLSSAMPTGPSVKLPLRLPDCRGTADLLVTRNGRQIRLGPFSYSGGDSYQLS